MKRIAFALAVMLGVAGLAAAQVSVPTLDILGAHNVYGRGCIACHAPHSGAAGNGANQTGNSGNLALWGQDLSPLYGQTFTFAGGDTVTIPNYYPTGSTTATTGCPAGPCPTINGNAPQGLPSSSDDGTFVIAACLSCHDGNVAVVGMMRGHTVEQVTISGATFTPPTLLGNDGSIAGNYLNDHPVGPNANPWCGAYGWDCTVNTTTGAITAGPNQTQFFTDYFNVMQTGPLSALISVAGGYSVQLYPGGPTLNYTNSWITCTTCHDQHNMQYFSTDGSGSAASIKPTRFFVRGWYNPGNTATSNSAAQFCRSCHGGESNEMHGQIVPTM
jgi:hypothetical protein